MYISDIVRRSARSLRQAKARTLLTAAAIGVGTFALTLTLAASNGAQQFVSQVIADNFDPAELIVANDKAVFGSADNTKPREYDPSFGSVSNNSGAETQIKRLTDDDIAKIKAMKGVDLVRNGVTVSLQYITRPGQKQYAGTVQAFSPAQKPDLAAGSVKNPFIKNGLVLPEAYLSSLGFKDANDAIGKKVTFAIRKSFDQAAYQQAVRQGALNDPAAVAKLSENNNVQEEFTVMAVLNKPTVAQPGTELYMFVSADDALRLNDYATSGTSDYRKYTFVYVRIKNGGDKATLTSAQDALKEMGYVAQSVEDTQKFLTQIIGVLQGIVTAFGAIAIIASVFGVVNTMYISVLQRTREIGLMKALGMRKKDIGRLFRFEAAWIGFLGGVIGAFTAFLVGLALNPWITKKLKLGDGNELLIYKPSQIILLIFALMVVATVAGLLPARKAAKLDPIEALRTE